MPKPDCIFVNIIGWEDGQPKRFWIDSQGWIGLEGSERSFAKIDFAKGSDTTLFLQVYQHPECDDDEEPSLTASIDLVSTKPAPRF